MFDKTMRLARRKLFIFQLHILWTMKKIARPFKQKKNNFNLIYLLLVPVILLKPTTGFAVNFLLTKPLELGGAGIGCHMKVADFNGDGYLDLATTGFKILPVSTLVYQLPMARLDAQRMSVL